MKIVKLFIVCVASVMLCGCGEYQKVQKSTDADYKLDFAQRAYQKKQYVQAYTILADIIPAFKGTEKAEDALYLMAMSYYDNKEYKTASAYFKNYYTRFPRGKYTELARYYCGYGYFIDSPEPQLDQSDTVKAIEELSNFIEYYPRSERTPAAQNAIFELQDKLALKELENAVLYYNLGTYLGNNYASAVIVAQNALKKYPYTKYKEDLEMIILKSRYQEAANSVDEMKPERFRDVIDEYYGFINDFPDGKNRKEADNIFKIASRHVKDDTGL